MPWIRMLEFESRADPHSVRSLVRRLLFEQALGQWKRYAVAFALMAVAAGATALSAYLIGNVINAAYVDKNLHGIIVLALVTAVHLPGQGACHLRPYGDAVADRQPHHRAETSGRCSTR